MTTAPSASISPEVELIDGLKIRYALQRLTGIRNSTLVIQGDTT